MSPVRVLSPEGRVRPAPTPFAPALSSLAGRRIGVLDNGKPNAELLLRTIAERVATRAGAIVGRWPVDARGRSG